MANTQAVCRSFKTELMSGVHAFGTTVVRAGTTADTFKAALYLASATMDKTATAYTATGEVSGTNYSAGGVTVTNATAPTLSTDTSCWTPSANVVFGSAGTPVTLSTSFDCMLLYNSTQSNKAVATYTFGSQTVTAGVFTLTVPTNDASNALLRLA
jgi:hypothetical protein